MNSQLWKECIAPYGQNGVDAGVSWGRVRGRPRIGWMEAVNVAFGNRGMTVKAARQCAKDRKKLRSQAGTVYQWRCNWFGCEVCLNVTFLIVDLWQSCVCFIRSGITRCTLLMVLSLDRMCHAARVTRGALVTHRYTYAPPRCRTSQYSRTFMPISVSLYNDLAHTVFDGVGLVGFESRANAFLLA